ncbi:MAG: FAD-binding oxidoreductase [Alphaproteobacteria bacterium]|nr:FAD-binding oxidoreductase [Alphaproteobacteria bacterium]
MKPEIFKALSAIKLTLGPSGFFEDPADTQKYRRDWRGNAEGEALLVARPASTEEVSGVVKAAREAGIAIVPQGGNTGLVMGSIPTEIRPTIVLSLERMNRVRKMDADNFSVVAEAGCVIQNMQAVARDVDRLFPLSLASEGSSTVGGTLSTNAGGNQTIRFGNAREQVLGLEVVLADGTVLDDLNTLRKNNTGYDLKQMFIGAEGTLGIITAAAFRLMPGVKVMETAMLAVPSPTAAGKLLALAREVSGDQVLAFEIMPRESIQMALDHIDGVIDPMSEPSPWYVLLELSTASPIEDMRGKLEVLLEQAMEKGLVTDGVIAESMQQRAQLWRPREEQAEAGRKSGGFGLTFDLSIPVGRVAEFLEYSRGRMADEVAGLGFNTMGHMGDGNIHYSLKKPLDMDQAAWEQRKAGLEVIMLGMIRDYGGSFSAEHGIGSEKRETLVGFTSAARLTLMRSIKSAIDPEGIMNPGKVLL